MFSEILKIIPKLENKDLQAMQNSLQSRFSKIAKGFGKGITNAFKGGGIAGIALGLIDKVLNPIKEVQEAIDRTLKSSDDLATNANQFNTTTGKLFKLVQLAKATGLSQDNLFTLVNKYQGAVAEAKLNPNDPNVSAVKNFTGQKDTVEGFFQFIQAVQRMDKGQQVLVQQQVFGEKQILKMADFLQSDFPALFKQTGLDKINSDTAGGNIEKLAKLNDLTDALAVKRENEDLSKKASLITENMIRQRDASERLNLQRENQRIQSYSDLATISQTVDKMQIMVEEGLGLLGKLITLLTPFVNKVIEATDRFMKSPFVRGVKGLFGGKDD